MIHLVKQSSNRKIGPMACTMRTGTGGRVFGTCPRSCRLNPTSGGVGCYATGGPLRIHTNRLSRKRQRGNDALALIKFVETLPPGSKLRHHVFGDIMADGTDKIDEVYLKALRRAVPADGLSFTYTHSTAYRRRRPSKVGETCINISVETEREAVSAMRNGHPVCMVTASDPQAAPRKLSNGASCVICPAQKYEHIQCNNCGGRPGVPLCAMPNRQFVVLFLAHGIYTKQMDKRMSKESYDV